MQVHVHIWTKTRNRSWNFKSWTYDIINIIFSFPSVCVCVWVSRRALGWVLACVCMCVRARARDTQPQLLHRPTSNLTRSLTRNWAGHGRVCFPTPPLNVPKTPNKHFKRGANYITPQRVPNITRHSISLLGGIVVTGCATNSEIRVRFAQDNSFLFFSNVGARTFAAI